eukprot:NODE_2585_length_1084_cov_8.801932_g2149_i0.p1 GENE.NODE_2585_length_1084_cov_8.801932_g2149_i0~~NODE_2585_length_1084_cov_8.801932_g2149_i0.p1  ORF type:complete len:340 (-),score=81.01 NODE_2585_length_1084_cov_8.801932_g2149_i0:64-996(-)
MGGTSGLSMQHLYSEMKATLSKSKKMSAGFVRLINRFIKQLCDVEKTALQDYIVSTRSEQLMNAAVQVKLPDPLVEEERKKMTVEKLALKRAFGDAEKLENQSRVAMERVSTQLDQYKNAMYEVHLSIYKMFHSFYKHRWKWTDRLRDPLRVVAGQELDAAKEHNAKEVYRTAFRTYMMEVLEADNILLSRFTQYVVSDHLFGSDVAIAGAPKKQQKPEKAGAAKGAGGGKGQKPVRRDSKPGEADPAPPDVPGDPDFSPFGKSHTAGGDESPGVPASPPAAPSGSSMPAISDASPSGQKGKRASSVAAH